MTPEGLERLAFDFRAARALFAALELGVPEALAAERLAASELAERCQLAPQGARILLEALAALGVVERCNGEYGLAAGLAPALLPGAPGSRVGLWLHDLCYWSRWARLDLVLRTGAPPQADPHDPVLGSPEGLRRLAACYPLAMEQSAAEAPARLAERLAPLSPRRVLDLGGATGDTLVCLLEKLPEAHGILVDRGFVLARARERLARRGFEGRIELAELDFERDPLPQGCDLVLLSRVLMGLAPERAAALVRRAAGAVAPGGHLAIHEYDARSRVGALLSLDVLLTTGGEVHAGELISSWIAQAGLCCERVGPLLDYTRLLVARKLA